MALSASAALARAQLRSTWNRMLRQAGLGGEIATWTTLGIVALTLVLPCLITFRIGFDLGREIAASGDQEVLRNWNGLMAVLTVGFALLGAFRQKPVFPFARFGRYPVTPLELLIADLPSSAFEVFPLICAAATTFLNLGLAARMPLASPIIALLAADGIVAMLSLMIILSALWSFVVRHRVVLYGALATVAALSFGFGLRGLRVVLKQWLPEMAQSIPIAHGYAGLLALRAGETASGIAGIAVATAASALLLLGAAWAQSRRLASEMESPATRLGRESAFVFDRPASGISRLFVRQLLASTAVRGHLLIPLIFTGSTALVTSLSRAALADGKTLPEGILTVVARAEVLPLYAIVPLLATALNPQIWMNQFGWDRGGMRTLLLLPLEPGAILAGKLRGLGVLAAIETVVGAVPLFWIRAPNAGEIVMGVAAGGVALVITSAIGHIVSMHFPRGVDEAGGLQIPLHLSWIAPATMLAIVVWLAGLYAIGDLAGKGGGLVALVVSLAGVLAAYVAMLPRFGETLRQSSERLLSM